jgi:hypothetical protein
MHLVNGGAIRIVVNHLAWGKHIGMAPQINPDKKGRESH